MFRPSPINICQKSKLKSRWTVPLTFKLKQPLNNFYFTCYLNEAATNLGVSLSEDDINYRFR
jgi:hypothetical protein